MNLRILANQDMTSILEDTTTGFGWDITLTAPNGTSMSIVGFSGDIGTTIDPETQALVAGRTAHVSLPIAKITTMGQGLPRAIASTSSKPWIASFNDLEGASHTFKVSDAMPDRTLGLISCLLEAYK